MKILTPIYDRISHNWYGVVSAELVDIAPHLAHLATWVVHEHPTYSDRWRITNVETGTFLGVCDGERSKEGAISVATTYCAVKTEADLRRAYRTWLKQHGGAA